MVASFIVSLVALVVFAPVRFIWCLVWELPREVYLDRRYGRHGICPTCREPFAEARYPWADPIYGPDVVSQQVCPNGHAAVPRANRQHAADPIQDKRTARP